MMTGHLRTVVCVIGTRPEAIKMAPVVSTLAASDWARCIVVATAQHRNLLDQMLARFEIRVDHDLDLMVAGQHPSALIARMLPEVEQVFIKESAEVVLAQGDTTTTFVAALAAFNQRIPFGHIEAGLRTNDLSQPFPEEGYRQMVSRIARWHFAPTESAAAALRAEGVDPARVHVTGNTCIDALIYTMAKLGRPKPQHGRMVLLTAHRRENFGAPLENVFRAVRAIAEQYVDVEIVYPVHPNPNVRQTADAILSGHPRIRLIEPLDYFDFVDMMRRATLILTDSGGIQEEAPALGKPVLVLRDTTERPEAIAGGYAQLVGTNSEKIVIAIQQLLEDPEYLQKLSQPVSPFGDGLSAQRIGRCLSSTLDPKSQVRN